MPIRFNLDLVDLRLKSGYKLSDKHTEIIEKAFVKVPMDAAASSCSADGSPDDNDDNDDHEFDDFGDDSSDDSSSSDDDDDNDDAADGDD